LSEEPAPRPGAALAPAEVRRRASAGAAILGLRGVVILVFGLAGNLALAALLAPKDFGLLALGNVLIFVGRSLSEGGLVAGFIGRRAPPERRDLEAALGFQLAVTVVLAAAFSAGAVPFGADGVVLAVMAWSVPLTSFRIPASLVLERQLLYGPVATVEVVEAVCFYVAAVALVVAGAGVAGVAAAAVLRAALGSLVMARIGPVGWLRPRWDFDRIRGVLGFGVRVQQVGVLNLAREQGLSVGIAAIAGLGVLGLWTLANRVMQVPQLLFGSLKRISFPAIARLLDGDGVPRVVIERSIGLVGVGGVLIVPALVAGAQPLMPAVLGPEWDEVPPVLILSALGLMIGTPIGTVAVGYLYATDDPRAVLRCVALKSIAWLAVAFALVGPLGPEAVGLGWMAGGVVEALAFGVALRRRTGARLMRAAGVPLVLAAGAGGAGCLVASAAEPTVWLAAVAGLAALGVAVAGLLLVSRGLLLEVVGLARTALARPDGEQGGGGGIRTHEGPDGPFRLSRPVHSTALPPLRGESKPRRS
jgi:O-antigen/teichoic acid export membrane protein